MRFSRMRCFCLFHFILFAYIYNIHHTVSETEREICIHMSIAFFIACLLFCHSFAFIQVLCTKMLLLFSSSQFYFDLIVLCRFARVDFTRYTYVCLCVHAYVYVFCFFCAGLLLWNGCSNDLIMYAISPKNYKHTPLTHMQSDEHTNNETRKLASLQIISVNF